MFYVVVAILSLIILGLAIFLRRAEKKIKELEKQMLNWRAQMEQDQCEVWNCANTIHLYAMLSEEESSLKGMKEKQTEIIHMSERLMERQKNFDF